MHHNAQTRKYSKEINNAILQASYATGFTKIKVLGKLVIHTLKNIIQHWIVYYNTYQMATPAKHSLQKKAIKLGSIPSTHTKDVDVCTL